MWCHWQGCILCWVFISSDETQIGNWKHRMQNKFSYLTLWIYCTTLSQNQWTDLLHFAVLLGKKKFAAVTSCKCLESFEKLSKVFSNQIILELEAPKKLLVRNLIFCHVLSKRFRLMLLGCLQLVKISLSEMFCDSIFQEGLKFKIENRFLVSSWKLSINQRDGSTLAFTQFERIIS